MCRNVFGWTRKLRSNRRTWDNMIFARVALVAICGVPISPTSPWQPRQGRLQRGQQIWQEALGFASNKMARPEGPNLEKLTRNTTQPTQ